MEGPLQLSPVLQQTQELERSTALFACESARRPSSDYWVVLKGNHVLQPSSPKGSSGDDEPQGPIHDRTDEGQSCSTPNSTCNDHDPYVAVEHEDVVDAVAEFVKDRVQSQLICSTVSPKELAAAVSTAFSEEKLGRWQRLWGRGRLIMRPVAIVSEIADEFGPTGKTGQVIRHASSRAMSIFHSVSERVK